MYRRKVSINDIAASNRRLISIIKGLRAGSEMCSKIGWKRQNMANMRNLSSTQGSREFEPMS
jgi:hypothetical protein